jgi:hypothetical protein
MKRFCFISQDFIITAFSRKHSQKTESIMAHSKLCSLPNCRHFRNYCIKDYKIGDNNFIEWEKNLFLNLPYSSFNYLK